MAELDRAAIAVRLSQARTEAGLTQPELADVLEMHPRSVQNYENPKLARVPFEHLGAWADATGVTKEWLLHGNEFVATSPDRIGAIEERLTAIEQKLDELASSTVDPEVLERLEAAVGKLAGEAQRLSELAARLERRAPSQDAAETD